MDFKELRTKYTEKELSVFPGDNDLRFRVFSPFFSILFENKIVYYEKFICIARLENINISAERFSATAIPYLKIERKDRLFKYYPTKPWEFSATWGWMRLLNDKINVPYVGWTIWIEPEKVKAVEQYVLEGDFETALKITLFEEEEEEVRHGFRAFRFKHNCIAPPGASE